MSEPSLEIERKTGAAGSAVLRLRGACLLSNADHFWRAMQRELKVGRGFDLDLSDLTQLDGASAALLQSLRKQGEASGLQVDLHGGSLEVRRMLDLYDCERGANCSISTPRRVGFFEQVGLAARDSVEALRDMFAFVGELAISLRRAFAEKGSVNWSSIPGLMERAGADGVPIVILINFLVGLIIGLQAAFQLERFGAGLFIADMVGLSTVREMAPLMTAIVVAGRSGAAYAAELGTMKVNQEIDALWTMGFDPQRFLVLPRLIALGSVVPILTLFSMFVGIFGGLIVAVQRLNITTLAYFTQLQSALSLGDLVGGLIKSAVFAVTITLISCQRGLGTRGGAAGVGRSTTSAVVITLFCLVVLDALFTFFFNVFGV
ncbi:MAG: phospholipid/cholesterol/gamma-HCH transport system permease protein [Planctomycetota bacterium]